VHISTARFTNIDIHEDLKTVQIGAGLTWTDVYDYLVPKGRNVVGGRLNGVGVAGLTLGGGKLLFLRVLQPTNLIECL
jgi:FAD/FMN-containing dehydrogenase